ncbi:MAG: TolC family protein [Bacteroidales bacterium]|jgi:outer membrane protein TolC|nr:TolC family protein [Bacteroidales bacterium]
MKKLLILALPMLLCMKGLSQTTVLTLDSCRAMAISNNKDVRMSAIDKEIAENNKKTAFSKYLPRVNAIGAYVYTSKNINLISEEQEQKLRGVGNGLTSQIGEAKNGILQQIQQLQQNPQFLQYLQANPQMAIAVEKYLPQLVQTLQSPGRIESALGAVSGVGNEIADALTLNTHNIFLASIMLTQPIYMGGKIIAYNKITDYLNQVEESKYDLQNQELIVKVDEAYWQIVSLESKKKLAESYLNLLRTLDANVEKLVENGFATKADGLSVKVKLNEAEVTVIQVDNGLSLCKMLLCQICGMPLESDFTLADATQDDILLLADISEAENIDTTNIDAKNVNRPELNALELATKIYEQKVNVARAEFLPNVALTGGYTWTNPSCFNGFENKMKGMWTVGVGVKIPIITSGERIYKTRVAKLEAEKAECKLEETREKIELQVKQSSQRVIEAAKRLSTAQKSLQSATENLRYANVGLKEGVIPVSNVLEAQTGWLKAQSTMVQAKIDLKLAQLYLNKATGRLNY